MNQPVILEFGSHSLKLHYRSRSSGVYRKVRFPWNLGHEVYTTGRISARSAERAIDTIRELREKGFNPRSLLAIATGALRDAENGKAFLRKLQEKLGIEVRVISGREEASLLAQGYLAVSQEIPALIADIGGGSLELVYLGKGRRILRDSLPLGTIRLYHLGAAAGRSWDDELVRRTIASEFQEASVLSLERVHATGGTVKAAAKLLGKSEMTLEELSRLEEKVRRDGPPAELAPDRARVFLPGLMVLRHLLEHTHARVLRHIKVSIGRIFLERLTSRVPAAGGSSALQRYMLRDLRITQISPPLPRPDGGHAPENPVRVRNPEEPEEGKPA